MRTKEQNRIYQQAWRDANREKERKRQKEWAAAHLEQERERKRLDAAARRKRLKEEDPALLKKEDKRKHYRRSYGISLGELKQIGDLQNWICPICQLPLENTRTGCNMDHCHTTGKNRGLLHRKCNALLGYAKDNEQILLNAILYLEHVKEQDNAQN